jgi:hypothetical protein
MSMKRFLILFIVIAYSAVGCAGSNQWRKPDFQQEAFEKDRGECIQTIDKKLVSEAFGRALEECLSEKGYKYRQAEYKHRQVEYREWTTAEKVLLCAVLIPVGVAILILSAGAGVGRGGLGGFGR